MKFKFKEQNPDLNDRQSNSSKIKEKYPDRIPIICEKDPNSKIKSVDKNKYLVPSNFTVSQFNIIIRKRLELNKESALFLLVSGKHSITGDSSINEVYERYKDEDGFLYVTYTSELSWGK